MAKVSAPLMSFSASGKLADALVFFPWKGIQSVRQYVVPANPKTGPQIAQRAHMTAAVAEWHGADYNTLDRSAWRVYAGTLTKIMAGFNAMCRAYINERILGNTWERMSQIIQDSVSSTGFRALIGKASGGNAPHVHYGTSKLYMPGDVTMTDLTGNYWSGVIPGLVANTGYYFYIHVGATATDYARTGIYYQRTLA